MELPEPRWAVKGILPEGLTLHAAKPEVGKAWMDLGLSLAIASGGMALGSIPVEAAAFLHHRLPAQTERPLRPHLSPAAQHV